MVSYAAYAGLAMAAGSSAHADPINYALGKPATASSSYAGGGAYATSYGNDGNVGSGWVAPAFNAWWQVDLGAIFSVAQISIFSWDDPGYQSKFQLSSSLNGTDWSAIGGPTVGTGVQWNILFDTAAADMRYVRYTTIIQSNSPWSHLAELEVLSADQAHNTPEPATLALALAGLGLGAMRRGVQRGFFHEHEGGLRP